MPRDGAGNYSLPALGNPAVTNTPITIAWWNGTSSDMATTFTDSLSRSGLGGMLAPFKLVDGTVGAPAFAFQSESTTGFYRALPSDMRVSILGVDVFQWTPTGVASNQKLTVLGGVVSTGLVPNGNGGTFTASGAGQGLAATGGSGAGNAGTWGIAGTVAGYGAIGQGVSGGVGAYAYSSATNVDVLRADGYVDLSHGTNPSVGVTFTNRVTPKNVCKVWVVSRTDGAGNITIADGFNVSTISISGATVTLTFGTSFSTANYAVVGNAGQSSIGKPVVIQKTRAVGSCTFDLWDVNAGALYNLATVAMDIIVHIYGAQ